MKKHQNPAQAAYNAIADIHLDFLLSRPVKPVFKKGQRVEDFLYGPGTVLRRTKRDYWVLLDSGTKELIGGGDLTLIEE